MAIGDVTPVTHGECCDLHCIDTGMFGVEAFGAVYLLDADRPAIVETGLGTNHEFVLRALDEVGIDRDEVAVIAPTHVHLDHAGGAGVLAEACPNATVAIHEIGAPHLSDPTRLIEGTRRAVGGRWRYYSEPKPIPEERIRPLTDGDVVDLGNHELRVHHVPGHAPHQVVFHDPANAAIFTADAAGIWIPGRGRIQPTSPPPNFDLELALSDLDVFRSIGPETLLYSHFGPVPYSDDLMDDYEQVLTDWVTSIADERTRRNDDDVIERFVEETDLAAYWGDEQARMEVEMNVEGAFVYLDRRAD